MSLTQTLIIFCFLVVAMPTIMFEIMISISDTDTRISELMTPRLSYTDFQKIIASRPVAIGRLERVTKVSNYLLGPYLSIKFKKNTQEYHVYRPRVYAVDTTDEDSELKLVMSYGITTEICYICR